MPVGHATEVAIELGLLGFDYLPIGIVSPELAGTVHRLLGAEVGWRVEIGFRNEGVHRMDPSPGRRCLEVSEPADSALPREGVQRAARKYHIERVLQPEGTKIAELRSYRNGE